MSKTSIFSKLDSLNLITPTIIPVMPRNLPISSQQKLLRRLLKKVDFKKLQSCQTEFNFIATMEELYDLPIMIPAGKSRTENVGKFISSSMSNEAIFVPKSCLIEKCKHI